MAPSIPAGEPTVLNAGTTWKWTQQWSDFPIADGWSVTYYATGPSAFTVSTSQSGSDFLAAKAATETAAILPGLYTWEARATLSSETYVAGSGTLMVGAKPSANEGVDGRSHAQLMLARVEAEIEARITGTGSAHESYGNGDQTIAKLPIEKLRALRVAYSMEVQRQQNGGALPTYEVTFARP